MRDFTVETRARLAVHEVLLLQLLRGLGTASEEDMAWLKSLMIRIEQTLIDAHRNAKSDEAEIAGCAREYFEHISKTLIASLPHHGKH